MAVKAQVYKLELQIADLRRQYYDDFSFTLVQHPSETVRRMLARVLVFSLCAHPDLQMTRGLSTEDEPDLWRRDTNGRVLDWVELGQVDRKRIRKAVSVSDQIGIFGYDPRAAKVWWQKNEAELARIDRLAVGLIDLPTEDHLTGLVDRHLQLHCTIDEENLLLSSGNEALEIAYTVLKQATKTGK